MTSSTNEILEELKLKLEPSDHESAKFFQENGYCIIPPSQLVLDNIDEFRKIIDRGTICIYKSTVGEIV